MRAKRVRQRERERVEFRESSLFSISAPKREKSGASFILLLTPLNLGHRSNKQRRASLLDLPIGPVWRFSAIKTIKKQIVLIL